MVIQCRSCSKKARVKGPGKFRCPNCQEIDEVDEYGQFAGAGEEEEDYGEDEGGDWEQAEFPLVIECRYCSKKARVNKAGKFRCPSCQEIDEIDEYGQFAGADEEEDYGDQDYGQDEEEEEEQEPMEFPQIIQCRHCDGKMRVKEPGKFKCPSCGEIDQMDEYGNFGE